MIDDTATTETPANLQGDLWGERARDWADVMEGWNGWGVPLYRHVLERVPVAVGTRLLDVGCGAGRFCRVAADRGAEVAGIDASGPLVGIARERIPAADLRVGDMEQLPWGDASFDVVTGFNSFFIAADMLTALREARRVARDGGVVAMTVFGRPDRCESTAVFSSLAQFASTRNRDEQADGEPGPPPLHEEGALEAIAAEAGLAPREAAYVYVTERYADLDTMVRGYCAAAPFVRAARVAGDEAVRAALGDALRPLEQSDGSYRLVDELRYLIAVA